MFFVLSFSYKKLEISLREKLAFPRSELQEFYTSLFLAFPNVTECILVSTCNRFELFLFAQMQDISALIDFIASYRHFDVKLLQKGAQIFSHQGAVEHIFRVASSLDSLVLGETQITGQLKEAYQFSYESGFCKKELTRVMHFAFKTAALVRSQTQISKNPISVASVAVSHFCSLVDSKNTTSKIVVIGTGEMGILCVKYLLSHQYQVLLLSRTLQNAQALKEEMSDDSLEVASFAELHHVINTYPYLFCATGAPHVIITEDMIQARDFHRIWFDLALPRDIECFKRSDIELYSIDDFQTIMTSNKNKRENEVQKAQEIISRQVCTFFQWLESLEVEPIIKALREKAKQCCIHEVSRAIKKGFLKTSHEEEILRILHNVFNKFLHYPTTYIKTIKEHPESDFILEGIKKLFDLEGNEIFNNPYKCERHNKEHK